MFAHCSDLKIRIESLEACETYIVLSYNNCILQGVVWSLKSIDSVTFQSVLQFEEP